jgi:S-DNA-T family DNA segregation ATPase FtsK/SpoIIIE
VLAVDDVGQLRARLPGIDPLLVDVGMRGTRAGIHLVLTCSKWAELRGGLREGITHRLEFALADPTESELPRHRALQLHRESLPGRACLADGRLLQVALPRFSQPMSNGQRGWSAVTAMARRVKGDRHRPVTLLPSALPLPPSEPSADGLLVGVRAPDLEAVRLDPSGEEGHLLVLGDARSGRSSLLRAIITQVRRRCRAAPLTLWVVDPRGSLHTAATCKVTDTAASSGPKVPVTRREELTYARTASEVQAVADALSAVLTRSRTAATELAIAPAAPSESRGWGGEPGKPLHVLIVDDHDLVLGPASTALAGLATHLPYAVENGLRLVLVRRVTGYSRAAYDPIVSALRELGAPGLVLSGDPLEGPVLYGARAERRPPGRGALLRVDGSQVTLQVAAFPSPDHTDQQLGSADKPR